MSSLDVEILEAQLVCINFPLIAEPVHFLWGSSLILDIDISFDNLFSESLPSCIMVISSETSYSSHDFSIFLCARGYLVSLGFTQCENNTMRVVLPLVRVSIKIIFTGG